MSRKARAEAPRYGKCREATRRVPAICWIALAAFLAGCNRTHSALGGASPQDREFAALWWIFFGVSAVVFVLVMAFLVGVLVRARRTATQPTAERRLRRVVIGAVTATVVTLLGLLFADFFTGRALGAFKPADALTIKVVGHQWWWEAEYQDPSPANVFATANELHVPVGRPVRVLLRSHDVIHSFWMPSLQGKKDLIPGHPTSLWFQADRAGTFRGQCAEFCGYQHAHMGIVVVAEPPEKFAAWRRAQLQSAPDPLTDAQRHGREVFLTHTCVMCHTIGGTRARSRLGPDLTHLASRQSIAADAFPNTRGNLARWVVDAPLMKPGTQMPENPLGAADLNALLDYLETLK